MKQYRSKKAGREIRRTYYTLLNGWGVPYEEIMLSTRYGSTHVITCGQADAPPLVLFHGVGDDSALMWYYNAAALSRRFRLYAVDTIGGPGLSEPADSYNAGFDDVLWLDDLFDGLGLGQSYLAGVSHGGYLVQLYALERPDRVAKGICLASAVPGEAIGHPMKNMLRIFLPEALVPTKRNTERLLRKLCGADHSMFTESPDILTHYRWLLRGFNNMAMARHKLRSFSTAELDHIRGRLIYFAGSEDPFMKLGGKEALLKAGMNATFFDGVGHGINHEIAEEINSRIIGCLLEEDIPISPQHSE